VKDIQTFFKYGLDRQIPQLLDPEGTQLNLGPGDYKIIPHAIGVGRGKLADVDWWAPERLPFAPGSIAQIHAYQFFEHLEYETVIKVLRDCERVLAIGGVLNIVTPYAGSQHDTQALDHKTHWTEETWDWLLNNTYYSDHGIWLFEVHCCFIMGIVYRNLDLFTQLRKVI
jgi:SAM-dependent methyltransferase